jgi:hypothetical protein
MSHSFLGPSASERWINCPPSARLCEGVADEESAAAAEGTAAHALAEWKLRAALGMEVGIKPECADSEMERHTDDYVSFVMEQHGRSVFVEQQVDFSEWVPEGFGTSDAVVITDGCIHVIDFKYGIGRPLADSTFNIAVEVR